MWFKNARIYSVELSDELLSIFRNPEQLESAISKVKFKPVAPSEMSSSGFAPIYGRASDLYTFTNAGCCFLKILEAKKLLPSTIVNQAVAEEIEIRENQLKRPLKKDEKSAIKTAILQKMISQAFVSRKESYVWINYDKGLVATSASSASAAESAIALVREAFGTFPAKPLSPKVSVEGTLSEFVRTNDLPNNLTLGFNAVLKSIGDEGATVRISRDDLTSDEVINHLDAGKEVTELQLFLESELSFMLSNDLCVKRIAVSDLYMEQNLPEKTDDPVADFQGFMIVESDVLTTIGLNILKTFKCETKD